MSEFTIYIKLPAYERQWCEHHYGTPCTFLPQSNVNKIIRHFLKTRPEGALPSQQQPDEVAIYIPSSKSKNPIYYNYLTKAGKDAIREAIDDLFSIQMWKDLTGEELENVSVTYLIEDWMQENGIDSEQFFNLKQKFTRMKDAHRKCGVNVSRRYKRDRNTSKKR